MPLVRFAFTNVFFKGNRTFLLFSKSNKPLFRTWPSGQGSKELCGTGEILSGLCRHQVATKRVLTNAYCVIDADYNNLTIHTTQCVINAQSPNAYCAINTQCAIKAQCHQPGWQKLAAFRRGQKGHTKNFRRVFAVFVTIVSFFCMSALLAQETLFLSQES